MQGGQTAYEVRDPTRLPTDNPHFTILLHRPSAMTLVKLIHLHLQEDCLSLRIQYTRIRHLHKRHLHQVNHTINHTGIIAIPIPTPLPVPCRRPRIPQVQQAPKRTFTPTFILNMSPHTSIRIFGLTDLHSSHILLRLTVHSHHVSHLDKINLLVPHRGNKVPPIPCPVSRTLRHQSFPSS